jgi:DNA-binding LytR/AlgR family response regulator
MSVELERKRSFDEFKMEQDILYFKVGDHGLVSFHGKNFNIKKRMSSQEFEQLKSNASFFRANTTCYINLEKIDAVQDGRVLFDATNPEGKSVMVTRLRENRLKEIFARHSSANRNLG